MKLAYLDESEVREADRYFVGALICDPETANDVVLALDTVVADAVAAYGLDPQVELHGYALANGTEGWGPMAKMLRARLGIYLRSLEVLSALDLKFLVRGVDTRRLLARHYIDPFPPHEVAVTHVLQRLNSEAVIEDDYVLVIADEHHLADDLRRKLREWKRDGTPGKYMQTRLPRVLDTFHFSPSQESRLLQASDLLTYMYQRLQTNTPTDSREVKYMDEVRGLMGLCLHRQHGTWYP